MKLHHAFIRGALSLFLVACHSTRVLASWEPWAPGLEYQTLNEGRVHVLRFNPQEWEPSLQLAAPDTEGLRAHEVAERSVPSVVVNGGYFDVDGQVMGYRIDHGQQYKGRRSVSWWGILQIRGTKAQVLSARASIDPRSDLVLQAGPRLAIHGKVPKVLDGVARRTAFGVDRKGRWLLVVSLDMLSLKNLGVLMLKPEEEGGLACVEALNFDGGGSTQLSVHLQEKKLELFGFSRVRDVLIFRPRNKSNAP